MDHPLLPLMVHADDGAPYDPLDASSAAPVAAPAPEGPVSFWDEGADPNDLVAQRWGVVAPEGPAGDRLLAAIEPLVAHRREQQDGYPVKVYRVPPGLSESDAARWRKAAFDPGDVLLDDVPRYPLLLGDLEQVSFGVQKVLAVDGWPGRLAFAREEDYAAYAEKVLRWERAPAAGPGDALLYTAHDGSGATTLGHRALMAPGLALLQERHAAGRLGARAVRAAGDPLGPSADELLDLARTDLPSLLFTMSHGHGARRGGWGSPEAQREGQGALALGRDALRAGDLAGAPFLPGGFWFLFACFGAGTPDHSAYVHWLRALRDAGQFRGNAEGVLASLPVPGGRPFVAALPQAALASPDGPLAVVGHLDLAWSYGFQDFDTGAAVARPARFMGVVRSVFAGDRAGLATRELTRFGSQVNAELTALADDEARGSPPSPARRGHLWMLRQDLAAYVLLGDPAVRLPAPVGRRGGRG